MLNENQKRPDPFIFKGFRALLLFPWEIRNITFI